MMGGVKDPMGTKWTAGPAPESAARAAPEITGQGIPNPIGLILSGVMLLGFLGEKEAERRIRGPVARVLKEDRHLTPDLGGHSRTTDLTRAILAALL